MSELTALNRLPTALQAVWSFIARVPATRYRQAIFLLQLCLLAWLLALFFWHFMPASVPQALPVSHSASPAANTSSSAVNTVNIKQMQGWHLFGEAKKAVATVQPKAQAVNTSPVNDDAKETKLALTLLGVIASSVPEHGHAIILYQSKSDVYHVGQKLPVGRSVTLSKVLADRAIIDNNGKYEALFLYDEKGKRIRSTQAQVVKPAEKVLDYRSDKKRAKVLSDYRKRLIENPMSMADTMQITMAQDAKGQFVGYRVHPGSDANNFRMFGLEPGDVITEINGTPLNDPNRIMEIYQNLNNVTEASFVINRGGSMVNIMVGIQ